MNSKHLNIVLLCLFSCITSSILSQTVKADVDRNSIFIGEEIILKLSVEGGHAGLNWFRFPDSLNHLEITGRSKIDTVLNGGVTNYYQRISITSFDSGRWEFPPLAIAGINATTAPISIDVMPVDVSTMQDYNDIKDIQEVTVGINWWIIGLIAIITLLAIAAAWWLIVKKKKAAVPTTVAKGKMSPLEWAQAELTKLNAQDLPAKRELKKYYSGLTDISRTFFLMQLQQELSPKTANEWMVSLQPVMVDTEVRTSFYQFLRLADAVKFAKYFPPQAENDASVEAVRQMLQKVSLLHSNIYSKYQPQ